MASLVCKIALLLLAQSASAGQKGIVDPDTVAVLAGPQRVEGRIVIPGAGAMVSVGNVWVTLHRVGSDLAGPLDSVRVRSDGRYAFSYERSGRADAIYFVSAMYSGIAYFTRPLQQAVVKGEDAEIVVFDTTSRNIDIGVAGHHIIVSSADANAMRSVTEVFELANDSARTLVGSDGLNGRPTWSTPVPSQASGFQVGQGDIPAAAVTVSKGRARIFAPLAPGLRQLSFTYMLPGSAFPVTFPLERLTSVYEILIEDAEGTVTAPTIKEVDPVSMERRQFRRFLASDIPAGAVATVDVPRNAKSVNRTFIVLLTLAIGGAMIAALARAFMRA